MPLRRPWLLIGVSARIYYPEGPVFDRGGVWTKTLHFLEQSAAHWLMRVGATPVIFPVLAPASALSATSSPQAPSAAHRTPI